MSLAALPTGGGFPLGRSSAGLPAGVSARGRATGEVSAFGRVAGGGAG
jgi:hypothetical protein